MSLRVDVVGNGPPLVLLHGWAMHGGIFAPLVDALRERRTLHVIDLPGQGHNRDCGVPLTLEACAEAVLDVVPAAPWCGWSLGGLIALHAAATRPQRIPALAMVCATPKFVVSADWPHGMPADTFATFVDGCRSHTQVTLKRFKSLCSQGAQETRSLLRLLEVGVPHTDPVHLIKGLEVLGQLDTRAALQGFAGPQLHLYAGRDALVPAEAAKALFELLQDVEVGIVEDSAHAFVLEHPQELAAFIKTFLHESGDD